MIPVEQAEDLLRKKVSPKLNTLVSNKVFSSPLTFAQKLSPPHAASNALANPPGIHDQRKSNDSSKSLGPLKTAIAKKLPSSSAQNSPLIRPEMTGSKQSPVSLSSASFSSPFSASLTTSSPTPLLLSPPANSHRSRPLTPLSEALPVSVAAVPGTSHSTKPASVSLLNMAVSTPIPTATLLDTITGRGRTDLNSGLKATQIITIPLPAPKEIDTLVSSNCDPKPPKRSMGETNVQTIANTALAATKPMLGPLNTTLPKIDMPALRPVLEPSMEMWWSEMFRLAQPLDLNPITRFMQNS